MEWGVGVRRGGGGSAIGGLREKERERGLRNGEDWRVRERHGRVRTARRAKQH